MEIRELDLADDDVLHRIAGVGERVRFHERPHAAAFDEAVNTAHLRATDSGERQFGVVAVEGAEVLGFALGFIFLHDNRDLAWLDVQVDPPQRGHGVGTALLDAISGLVAAEGRTTLLTETNVPFETLETHPQRRFLEHRGFTYSNVEVVRHQPLPVADAALDGFAARAAERASAYRIETFVGPVPDELRESLCTLLGLLGVDAPTGDVDFEEELVTLERLAERYVNAEAMGRDIYETLAISPDGVVAAQSTIAVPRQFPEAFQWGTYVHRDHRGHSLGLAVKVANLRAVQAAAPHLSRVETQNAETNQWMIAINEELGYSPVEASLEMVRRL